MRALPTTTILWLRKAHEGLFQDTCHWVLLLIPESKRQRKLLGANIDLKNNAFIQADNMYSEVDKDAVKERFWKLEAFGLRIN